MNAAATEPQRPLRVAVVDDEPAARRGIQLLLSGDPEVLVAGEAGDVPSAIALLERESPDILFLDVQMPGGEGFDVLQAIGPERRPVVIFVTAYNEYALKAFDVHAVDYLLKPYEDARFATALGRAKEIVRSRQTSAVQARLSALLDMLSQPRPEAPALDRILIKDGGEIVFLRSDEIDWIEAEGDYMKYHTAGKSYLQRETMSRLEARLPVGRFVRIHRSTIVNLDRVRKLSPTFIGDYAVVLQDGTKLKLSRGYYDRLAELLEKAR